MDAIRDVSKYLTGSAGQVVAFNVNVLKTAVMIICICVELGELLAPVLKSSKKTTV